MKNIISWARTTIQKLPVPTNQEQLKTQNRVVLFASLSILQDLKGKTDNLPEGPEHASEMDWARIMGDMVEPDYLKHYQDSKLYAGICNFNFHTGKLIHSEISDRSFGDYKLSTLFRNYCSKWPKHSGLLNYPVPYIDSKDWGGDIAREKYIDYWDNSLNMWDRNSEYGELRWELVDFVRDLIAEDLRNANFNL